MRIACWKRLPGIGKRGQLVASICGRFAKRIGYASFAKALELWLKSAFLPLKKHKVSFIAHTLNVSSRLRCSKKSIPLVFGKSQIPCPRELRYYAHNDVRRLHDDSSGRRTRLSPDESLAAEIRLPDRK